MLWRFGYFLVWQVLGGLLGWWQGGLWGMVVGTTAAAWLWFGWDMLRGARVLRWLREGDLTRAPNMRGMWGEAADRARRLLRQNQQQVHASDARLQEILAALQATPNGVVLLDGEGHIEWCNQIAATQFGFDAQRDVMQSIGNLVRDPDFSAYYAGQDFSHDVVLQGRNSTPSRPVRISVHLHPYGDGRKLLLSRDVTALEQAEVMRRDFVANVSHEIRTPLTVLAGFIETLQTLPLDVQERSRYLALMAQQAARMQSVVQDLLTLSRLEGSPLPSMSEWTPVSALMRRCEEEGRALSSLLSASQARQHVLQFPSQEALVSVGDLAGAPAELQSALSNLINNAIRYTPAGGQIMVTWSLREDASAVFSVADTGPGIAAEHIPRLTERFYRVDRSRSRETGGTGLGLAIVKHVLQRHGAALEIQSTVGKGSTFSAIFPPSRLRSYGARLSASPTKEAA